MGGYNPSYLRYPRYPHRPDVKAEIRARWIDDAGYLAGHHDAVCRWKTGSSLGIMMMEDFLIFFIHFLNLLNSMYMCVL